MSGDSDSFQENHAGGQTKWMSGSVILILVVCAFTYWFIGGPDLSKPQKVAEGDTAEDLADPLDIGNDSAAIVYTLKTELEDLRSRQRNLEEDYKDKERELRTARDDYQSLASAVGKQQEQLQKLASEFIETSKNNRKNGFEDAVSGKNEDMFGDESFFDNLADDVQVTETVEQPYSGYGSNYFLVNKPSEVLGSPAVTASTTAVEKEGEGEGFGFDLFGDGAKKATNTDSEAASEPSPEADSGSSNRVVEEVLEQDDENLVSIPALSFADITILHGVRCPIGAEAVNSPSSTPARPVTLPIRGKFHGPNGFTEDLGTAFLFGLCTGRPTARKGEGRAEIRILGLSYWDDAGGSQFIKDIGGYVVDNRDNELDVVGQLEHTGRNTLIMESSAAAAAAVATTFSAGEFENVVNSDGDTLSALTGNTATAAGNAGLAALFRQIASQWKKEARYNVDTVNIPPGVPVKLVLDREIKIKRGGLVIDQMYLDQMNALIL